MHSYFGWRLHLFVLHLVIGPARTQLLYANNMTPDDFFHYPPPPKKTEGTDWRLTYNDGDILEAAWGSSAGNESFQFVCCHESGENDATLLEHGHLCTVLYQTDLIIPSRKNPPVWILNLTLSFGPVNDCFVWIDQPYRGQNMGIGSGPFNVNGTSSMVTYRTDHGNTTLSGPTDQMNGTSGNVQKSNVTLNSDGDGTLFSPNCLNPLVDRNASCWADLNMSAWIVQWIQSRVPCTAYGNCTQIASGNKPWTTFFLTQDGFGDNSDCSHVLGSCNTQQKQSTSTALLDKLNDARLSYAAFAIYSIFDFYTSWYKEVAEALTTTSALAQQMALIIHADDKAKHNWLADVVAGAISMIVALIPNSKSAPFSPAGLALSAVKAAGGQLAAASKSFWPKHLDPIETAVEDAAWINFLTNGPQSVKTIFQNQTNDVLGLIMGVETVTNSTPLNDYGFFVNATESGLFSAPRDSQFKMGAFANNNSKALLSSMNAYIFTKLLDDNGYYAVILPGVDPRAIYKDASNCPKWAQESGCNEQSRDLGCKGQLDSYNMCQNLWYDEAQGSSYTLLKDGKTTIQAVTDILHKVVDLEIFGAANDTISPFQYLFEFTARCSLQNTFPADSNAFYGNDSTGKVGFFFDPQHPPPIPNLNSSSTIVNDTLDFLPLVPSNDKNAGQGFVDCSKDKACEPQITHQNNTLFTVGGPGQDVDVSCLSALNVSVANFWAGQKSDEWVKKTPK